MRDHCFGRIFPSYKMIFGVLMLASQLHSPPAMAASVDDVGNAMRQLRQDLPSLAAAHLLCKDWTPDDANKHWEALGTMPHTANSPLLQCCANLPNAVIAASGPAMSLIPFDRLPSIKGPDGEKWQQEAFEIISNHLQEIVSSSTEESAEKITEGLRALPHAAEGWRNLCAVAAQKS